MQLTDLACKLHSSMADHGSFKYKLIISLLFVCKITSTKLGTNFDEFSTVVYNAVTAFLFCSNFSPPPLGPK